MQNHNIDNNIDKTFVIQLIQEIEQTINRKPHTPTDFNFLSEAISDKTKQYLSSTTLMRLWGYVKVTCKPRITTLNIMSRFLNYPDYNSFEEHCKMHDDESHAIYNNAIITNKLEPGTLIELTWNPNRRCVIRHMGNCNFEIVVSENSKMKVGDQFNCHHLILNEPLYIFNLKSGENIIEVYEIGKKSGITSLKIIKE